MGYNEHYKKREEKMNLGKKYKQLFEGKVRSNDNTLLTEDMGAPADPVLAALLQKSKHADVRMGEDELYELSEAWEEWNVDNDDKYDDLVTPLDMAVELVQDGAMQEARAFLKTFVKEVVKVMQLEK